MKFKIHVAAFVSGLVEVDMEKNNLTESFEFKATTAKDGGPRISAMITPPPETDSGTPTDMDKFASFLQLFATQTLMHVHLNAVTDRIGTFGKVKEGEVEVPETITTKANA